MQEGVRRVAEGEGNGKVQPTHLPSPQPHGPQPNACKRTCTQSSRSAILTSSSGPGGGGQGGAGTRTSSYPLYDLRGDRMCGGRAPECVWVCTRMRAVADTHQHILEVLWTWACVHTSIFARPPYPLERARVRAMSIAPPPLCPQGLTCVRCLLAAPSSHRQWRRHRPP